MKSSENWVNISKVLSLPYEISINNSKTKNYKRFALSLNKYGR